MDNEKSKAEKSKAFKEKLKETEKLRRELKGQAAIALFRDLIQDYEKKKHEYKSRDEHRADIKNMADKAWEYADVFIDSYGYAWPRVEQFLGIELSSGNAGPRPKDGAAKEKPPAE